jgi:hypothetical protein
MKFLTCILFSLFLSGLLAAQSTGVHLIGEGNNNTVKLLWYVDKWPESLEGYIIKRRVITNDRQGKWIDLNKTLIYPELSLEKDLGNVMPDVQGIQDLKSKLKGYLAKTGNITLKPFSFQGFLEISKSNPDAVKNMKIAFSTDYDIALLSGFGLVDKNIPFDEKYEYGIFSVIGNKVQSEPDATYQWLAGTKPDLNLPVTIKAKHTEKKTKIELIWQVDLKLFNKLNVNGFNIYRQANNEKTVKLNIGPVWLSGSKETSIATYYDNTAIEGTVYTYSIIPVSIFGTEGNKTSTVYDPAKAYHIITPPSLTSIKGTDNPLSSEIKISWNFKKEDESFITGFIVERMDNSGSYKAVSETLPSTARNFNDIGPKRVQQYYTYRIKLITDDAEFKGISNISLFYFDPIIKPPVPKNLSGKITTDKGHQYIQLSWDPKSNDDSLTAGYHIYANFPPYDKMMMEGSIPLIKGNEYKYEVYNSLGARFKFQVSAQSKYIHESEPCKPIEIYSPTRIMPYPNLWPLKVDSNRVILDWRYDNVQDLKGFIVYQDKKIVANEKTLGKDARKWVAPPLEYGREYVFEMAAVSEYGVVSGMSFQRKIRILKKTGK